MRTVLLSTAPPDDPALASLLEIVRTELTSARHTVTAFDVSDGKIGYCQGEFDCWVRTPGRCTIEDVQQKIVAAMAGADALVLVGPIAFGGFGHLLKRSIDRLLCLLSPFFEKRALLTHHEPRYDDSPALYAIGLLAPSLAPEEAAAQAATFEALNDANALNLLAPFRGALAVDPAHPERWAHDVRVLLAEADEPGATLDDRDALRAELMAAARPEPAPVPPRGRIASAAVVVGSPKEKGTSASELLARAFVRALEASGVRCELRFAVEMVNGSAHAGETARAIAGADLLLLCAPLYVDALPSPTTRALELVARARAEGVGPRDAMVVPLVNCGFPEPEQTRTALRILRHFARAGGYRWGGALPLGAGAVVTPERSLDVARPPVAHVVNAIALAAPALAAGEAVPAAALDEILRPPMPEVLYRLAGDLGWRLQARTRGATQRSLRARPLRPH